MLKLYGDKSGLYAGCLSTSHCMAFSLSWDHMGTSIIMQQDDAIRQFTQTFIPDLGMQL
jgi:hypothetical protein